MIVTLRTKHGDVDITPMTFGKWRINLRQVAWGLMAYTDCW